MNDVQLKKCSDDELVTALQRTGESGPMVELWRRHNRRILETCRRWVRNHAMAEDLSQETFLRVMTHIQNFRPGNFQGWIQEIARNVCINHLQKATTRREQTGVENRVMDTPQDQEKNDLVEVDKLEQIVACLNELSENQRIVLKFIYLEECSYEATSERTGFPVAMVRSYAQNGRRMFAKIWEKKYGKGASA